MKFLNNIFKSDKEKAEKKEMDESEKSSEFGLGEFDLNDFPEEDRNKSFYFYEYNKADGEWVNTGDPICKIRIGEISGYKFKSVNVIASESGILEHTLAKDDLLSNGNTIYKLYERGEYQNENSKENSEYRSYFNDSEFKQFDKWHISDGDYVKEGEYIYEYSDSILLTSQLTRLGGKIKESVKRNRAEKNGYVDLYFTKRSLHIPKKELMYVIRENDNERIKRKFINVPNIIIDEFSNSTIIKWNKVSSTFANSEGIKTKSDDLLTDFIFSFNFIDNNDQIVFHFDSKQIKPKQFDKVSFLFENGEQIVFELATNPISVKKMLKYRGIITLSELELFANSNFKKWKISLVSDKREILGGEISEDGFYLNKNSIQIVIKKFASEYIDLVKKTIPDYKPTELKQNEPFKEISTEFCFVYLMHDTSNGYYKIGISNNPEYRERTLQSEKPTIEMIASKKFPIRKIADSIEKALHDTYSEKRLRGEWFELDAKDIEHIIETLR